MSEKFRMALIVLCLAAVGGLIWQLQYRPDNAFAPPTPPDSSTPLNTASPAASPIQEVRDTPTTQTAAQVELGSIQATIVMSDDALIPSDLEVTLILRAPEGNIRTLPLDMIDTVALNGQEIAKFAKLFHGWYFLVGKSKNYAGLLDVVVGPDQLNVQTKLKMKPVISYSGRVIDSNSQPVPDAHVFIAGLGMQGHHIDIHQDRIWAAGVSTNDAGEFELSLPTDDSTNDREYSVAAQAVGYATARSDLSPPGTTGIELILHRGGLISGHVVDKKTKQRVVNAELYLSGAQSVHHKWATTDDDGAFEFSELASGKYQFKFNKDDKVMAPESIGIKLGESEAVENLTLYVTKGAEISGRVYDEDTKKGLAGVMVSANPSVLGAVSDESKTDSSGHYRLKGLSEDRYTVSLDKIEGFGRERKSRKVATSSAVPQTHIDFVLSSGITISGKVISENGKPVEKVSVWGMVQGASPIDQTWTDATGRFKLAGFKPNAQVELQVAGGGHSSETVAVEIADTSITNQRIVMKQGGRLSGIVLDSTDAPAPDIHLSIFEPGESSGIGTTTKADGTFDTDGIRPGTYEIKFDGIGGDEILLATVSLAAGEHKKNLRLVIDPSETVTYSISGTITDDRGVPIPDVRVAVPSHRGYEPGEEPVSDTSGRYTVTKLNQREYYLRYSIDGHQDKNLHNIHAPAENVDVVLPRVATVTGTVISGETGEPIQAFGIRAANAKVFRFGGRYERIYRSDGKFTLDNVEPNVPLKIWAKAPDYANINVPIGTVRGGETLSGITIRMETPNKILGTVVDSNGDPISGVSVFKSRKALNNLSQSSVSNSDATTGADGRFELGNLNRGRIVLSTYKEGLSANSVNVDVDQPENTVSITLTNGAVFTGLVSFNGEPVANASISGNVISGFGPEAGRHMIRGNTGADGRFEFSGIPAGSGQIAVMFQNGSRIKEIDFPEDAAVEEDFFFGEDTASLEGYLLAAPNTGTLGRVDVTINSDGVIESKSTRTDDVGYYQIESIPPGEVTIAGIATNNPDFRKFATTSIGDNENKRVDIRLFGGATVYCTIENIANSPGQFTALMPGSINIPTDIDPAGLNNILVHALAFSESEDGQAVFNRVEHGSYQIMAVVQTGTDNNGSAIHEMLTQSITIQDDSDKRITLSF